MSLLNRLFSKRKSKNTKHGPKNVQDDLEELMQSLAWMVEIPSAILTPAVPLPAEDAAGWFGGAPSLPRELAWPEIDGTPLCFLAQIDLTKVPQDIWSGLGPRRGQLAVFIHPNELEAKALHIDGVTERREGPSPVSSEWFKTHMDRRPPVSSYFPEWPVRLTANVGGLPQPGKWRKGNDADYPNPFENEILDLTTKAHHPFDERTLNELIEQFDEAIERILRSTEQFLKTKKLKEDVYLALRAFQADVSSSRIRFSEIKEKLAPYCAAFDLAAIAPYMDALSGLSSGHFTYHRDDDQGYAEIEIATGKVTKYVPYYLQILGRHAKYVYLEAPQMLTAEARTRFEKIWTYDAIHERGSISGPANGEIHTPLGPTSPNEVLLDLPTSDLIGWIWGDCYRVVFSIARDDLANGKLSNLMVDITN